MAFSSVLKHCARGVAARALPAVPRIVATTRSSPHLHSASTSVTVGMSFPTDSRCGYSRRTREPPLRGLRTGSARCGSVDEEPLPASTRAVATALISGNLVPSADGTALAQSLSDKYGVLEPGDLAHVTPEEIIDAARDVNLSLSTVAARKMVQLTQPVPGPVVVSAMADPATAAAALSPAALTRAERTNGRIMVSSILGGAYLGFGGSMMIMVAGGTPLLAEVAPGLHSLAGAAVFPIGLALITFSGTEMITGNFCTSFMPLLTHPDRKENVKDLTKSWSISTAGNLVGSVAMATAASSLLFTTDPCITFAAALALKKVTLPTSVLFFKAVGANWLVNLALTTVASARTVGGKAVAIWLPITTFAALGLEHAVANMFLIPLGMLCGADVSVSQFLFGNLVPVLAGNGVGAIAFTCLAPFYMHLTKGKP